MRAFVPTLLVPLTLALAPAGCIQPQKPGGDGVDEAGSDEEPAADDEAPEGAGGDVEDAPDDGPNWGDAGRGGVEPEPPPEPEPELSDICAKAKDLVADGQQVGDAYVITGNTRGDDHWAGSCGGDGGDDVAYRFTAPKAGMWRFETVEEETTYDSLLHVRTTCDDHTTEVACNDDILEGQIRNSRVDLPLEEGDSVWLIVDAWGDERGRFALSAAPIPTLAPGAECDPHGERSVCPAGHFCRLPVEAFDTEEFVAGECVESSAPVLENATARIVGDLVIVDVVGSDASEDVFGLSMQFMQGGVPLRMGRRGGGRDTFEVGFDQPVYGQERFEARHTNDRILQFAEIDGLRLAILDSEGNTSEWVDLPLQKAPELPPGDACDLAGIDNTCSEGGVCVKPPVADGEPEPVQGICQVPTRPAIAAVEAYLNPRTNAIGLRVTGADPDRDVVGITVRLFDAEGLRVPSSPDGSGAPGSEMDLRFDDGDVLWGGADGQDPSAFVASTSRALPAEWEGITSVRLRVYDATDQHSDQAEAEFRPTPEIADGEACDAGGGLRACPDGTICDPATAQCTEPIAECPADWEVIDLNGHAHDGGRFVYRGNTEGAPDRTAGAGGTCGGGAGQDIFAFTVPGDPDAGGEPREWIFETDVDGRFDDTVMYVRSHCRYAGPVAELACNDDVEQGRQTASRIGLTLEAGTTVYVFVDGWQGDGFAWRGEYVLAVTPL